MPDRILIVEDDRELRELLVEIVRNGGHEPIAFPTAESALRAIDGGQSIDLLVTDLVLPGVAGAGLMTEVRRRRPEVPTIIMTAFGSIDSAIELVKAGAFHYLTKPLSADDLLQAVERALADSASRRAAARLGRDGADSLPEFVGVTGSMQDLYRMIVRAARSPHAVLVTGESGTGKELVARALHRLSTRSAFVTVNCGALPEQLMESELFGHERGAFTGADRVKDGLFHVADGGTLLLDEVAELPLALQPKLLRVLEQGELRRVGATSSRAIDVRVIAATNRDIEAEVTAGRFRNDLFWRLNVLTIQVPPLRDRAADIPLLAGYFLGPDGPAISDEAMAMLTTYPWPGNVRELRNAMLRAGTLATGSAISPDDLPARVREAGRVGPLLRRAGQQRLSLAELEKLFILQVLKEVGGNKSRAADQLGLDRKTLYRKLEEYRNDAEGRLE